MNINGCCVYINMNERRHTVGKILSVTNKEKTHITFFFISSLQAKMKRHQQIAEERKTVGNFFFHFDINFSSLNSSV